MKDTSRWGPLTGLLFVTTAVAAFLVGGDLPDPKDDTAREIVAYYGGHDGALTAGIILTLVACALVVFFCGYLRTVLEGDVLPMVAFAGGVILATGLAIDATITIALMETADDIDPAAVQSLSALFNNDFIPFALGALLILLASGLAIVRQRVLPRWLGWLAIVLAAAGPTPIGFVSFVGCGVWILLVSGLLLSRGRAVAAP